MRALSKLFNACLVAIKPNSETSEQVQSPWSRQRAPDAHKKAGKNHQDSKSTNSQGSHPAKDDTIEAGEEVNKNIPLKSLYQKLTYPMTNGQPPSANSGNPDKIARMNGECLRLSMDNESTDEE